MTIEALLNEVLVCWDMTKAVVRSRKVILLAVVRVGFFPGFAFLIGRKVLSWRVVRLGMGR